MLNFGVVGLLPLAVVTRRRCHVDGRRLLLKNPRKPRGKLATMLNEAAVFTAIRLDTCRVIVKQDENLLCASIVA